MTIFSGPKILVNKASCFCDLQLKPTIPDVKVPINFMIYKGILIINNKILRN